MPLTHIVKFVDTVFMYPTSISKFYLRKTIFLNLKFILDIYSIHKLETFYFLFECINITIINIFYII
jgi:hypothetical protein